MVNDIAFHKLDIPYRGCLFHVSYFIRLGSDETLLYLHGLGSSKSDFSGASDIEALRHCTLVAFDWPGCGDTNYCEEINLGIDDLVEITSKLIASLGLDVSTIIGHSLGGLTGLLFAGKYEGRLRRFINIEGNLAPEDCFLSRDVAQYRFDEFVKDAFLDKLKQQLTQSPSKGVRIFADKFRGEVFDLAFWRYCSSIVDYSDHYDLIHRFAKLAIPKLFIYGSMNSHLSYLQILEREGIRIVEVPHSSHWPLYDNPSFVYQTLAEFLSITTGCKKQDVNSN
ncbi:MAG TPA: alpha/beta hydrolase [Pyrinomonadaceae bacterium]|nr:alpha/beta hydrolase [Pyrinomonadaceae bacterium]